MKTKIENVKKREKMKKKLVVEAILKALIRCLFKTNNFDY